MGILLKSSSKSVPIYPLQSELGETQTFRELFPVASENSLAAGILTMSRENSEVWKREA